MPCNNMEAPGAAHLKKASCDSSGASELVEAQHSVLVPTPETVVVLASEPLEDKAMVRAPGTAAIEEVEPSAPANIALQEGSPTQAKKKKGFFSKGKRLFKRLGSGKKE